MRAWLSVIITVTMWLLILAALRSCATTNTDWRALLYAPPSGLTFGGRR